LALNRIVQDRRFYLLTVGDPDTPLPIAVDIVVRHHDATQEAAALIVLQADPHIEVADREVVPPPGSVHRR
jgi:hypothetical protein